MSLEVATTDVVTAGRTTEIREIIEQMDEKRVGSVVITEDDEPVGIVTDRTIALALREVDSIADVSVADVMTEELVTVSEDETHFAALEKMRNEGIRRIPIVDADGSLTGIITLDDLLLITAAELSHAADVIEQQAGPR